MDRPRSLPPSRDPTLARHERKKWIFFSSAAAFASLDIRSGYVSRQTEPRSVPLSCCSNSRRWRHHSASRKSAGIAIMGAEAEERQPLKTGGVRFVLSGEPQMSVCACSTPTPAGPLTPDHYGAAAWPLVIERQRLPRKVFRRSIAWLSDSLHTLRSSGCPAPRNARFRPLVRRCRTGFPPARFR